MVSDLHIADKKSVYNLQKLMNSKEIDYNSLDYILMPGDFVNDCQSLSDPIFEEELIDILTEFTKNIPTIASSGNHDLMTKSNLGKWKAGNRFLIYQTLRKIPNIRLIKNGVVFKTKEIDFAAFSPFFPYYEGLKENKEVYRRCFFANFNF